LWQCVPLHASEGNGQVQGFSKKRGATGWLGIFAVLCIMIASFPAASQAAQTADSPYGRNDFTSPRFGTHVEWSKDWVIDRTQSVVEQRREILVLVSSSTNSAAFIELHSQRSFRTAESLLDTFLERFSGDASFEITDDQRTSYPPTIQFSFESDGTVFGAHTQAEAVAGAWLVVAVLGDPGTLDDSLSALSDGITVDGRSVLDPLPLCGSDQDPASATPTPKKGKNDSFGTDGKVGKDNSFGTSDDGCITLVSTSSDEPRPTPTPRDTTSKDHGINDVTYRSPTFGASLRYDSTIWSLDEELVAADNNGRDSLTLASWALPATVIVETYAGHNGKAGVCIDLALREWGITPGADEPITDDRGQPIKGNERGRVWGAYLYSYEGTALAGYVECRALPGAAGVMVITLVTNEASFPKAYADLLPILDSINLNG
jgi:hypothetical protein